MDHLWSPWRYRYVTEREAPAECIFCRIRDSADGFGEYVVHRGESCYVVLNRFPYSSGHLMIVPHRHAATLLDTPPERRPK